MADAKKTPQDFLKQVRGRGSRRFAPLRAASRRFAPLRAASRRFAPLRAGGWRRRAGRHGGARRARSGNKAERALLGARG
jgi:hypothetical protein